MKKIIIIIFLLILISNVFSQTTEKISINDGWKFRRVGDTIWNPATVPGTVHTDLYANGLIPNPYFRDNEKNLQWIENEDWEYKTTFSLDEKTFNKHVISLIFEGLDTYAKIYLNDSLIISADNMFRKWEYECKDLLKKKENELRIVFASPARTGDSIANAYYKEQGIKGLPGGNRVFTRKAAYQYGWDFGPRFVTSGVWRNVYLEAWDFFTFKNIKIFTKNIDKDSAKLTAVMEVNSTEKSDFLTHITDEVSGHRLVYFPNQILPGKNIIEINFTIPNPKLWWSNGLGQPYIYHLFIESTDNKERWNSTEINFGMRAIDLIQGKNNSGESFYFKLNDIPVYIKGANYIPQDIFIPNVKKEQYRKLLTDVKNSNMNMLRVWGGGIYEDDYFYDLCDSLGIMVWQDFMFACGMFPGKKEFVENVMSEVRNNYVRLCNHPCIALWCGNNEIDEGWHNWKWQKEFGYYDKDSIKIWSDYLEIFQNQIPEIITKLYPLIGIRDNNYYDFFFNNKYLCKNYIPSSPKIGWGHTEAMKEGDSHYWGVWWGMEPFEMYEKKVPRFMSEFGFQAFPDISTIEKFTLPEDRYLNSNIMKSHQKHSTGYETIEEYMKRDFIVPTDFQEYIRTSQLLQAYGIRKAIEAQRRAKPYCMGTLFWQLNDCWPGVTWSAIDYYGNWKELMYKIKDIYADVLVSPTLENDTLKVYVVSDKLEELQGVLSMQLVNSDSEYTVWNKEIDITIPENSSKVYFQIPVSELLSGFVKKEVYFYCDVQNAKTQEWYPANTFLFVSPKENLGYYRNLLMK